MSHSLDVYVRNSSGKPMAGVAVEITIDGIVCGGTLHEITDSGGCARFETASGFEDHREIACVGDRWFGPFLASDGSYTIRIE